MNSDESRLAALRANYDAVVAKNAANRAEFEKAMNHASWGVMIWLFSTVASGVVLILMHL